MWKRAFCEGKYSDKAMGMDQDRWFNQYEKQPPTEGEKLHASMKEAGLGELWGGPEPPVPPAPEPKVHTSGKRWEKLLALNYGLASEDNHHHESVRDQVVHFADVTHQSDPKDACKYLAIEEHRCLLASHANKDPEHAAMKCVKWFEEWKRCNWDQYKFNEGLSYIEGPRVKRAYVFAPNRPDA